MHKGKNYYYFNKNLNNLIQIHYTVIISPVITVLNFHNPNYRVFTRESH